VQGLYRKSKSKIKTNSVDALFGIIGFLILIISILLSGIASSRFGETFREQLLTMDGAVMILPLS
jgi:hypothetical protein